MKTITMDPKDAEQVRHALGLSPEAFSVRLGYSPLAYRLAIRRGRLSRFMAAEIKRRFWRRMEP